MKVLIFSTAYFPFIGGAEIAVKEITKRLPGIDFDLITARMDRKLPRHEKIGSVMVHRVGFGLKTIDKFLLPILGSSLAKKLDKDRHYGAVWSIMASQGGIAAGMFKTSRPNRRLILTLQEGDEEEHLVRYAFGNKLLYRLFIRPWHLLPFKKADLITVISNDLKVRARDNSQAGILVVPNGVDVAYFSEPVKAEILSDLRKRIGMKEGEIMILTISRLVKKNAVNDAIRALAELEEKFKLVIIGIGPDEPELKQLTKELGLSGRVMFLGRIEHNDLPAYLQSADIFTRPSLSEGFGNVFVEAMAARVPVIATPVGGIPDFLFDPESNPEKDPTGLFCEVGDPANLADQIRRLYFEPSLRKELIANASRLVAEKYDWQMIADMMRDVFENKENVLK